MVIDGPFSLTAAAAFGFGPSTGRPDPDGASPNRGARSAPGPGSSSARRATGTACPGVSRGTAMTEDEG